MQSSSPAHQKIADQLAVDLPGFLREQTLILESVQVTGPQKLPVVRVFVDLPDGPGQVSEDQLDVASTAVSAALDELDPFPGAYQLEVSTSGAERPLLTPRLWRRSVGVKVEFFHDSVRVNGLLEDADETGFSVEVDGDTRRYEYGDVTQGHSRVAWYKGLEG